MNCKYVINTGCSYGVMFRSMRGYTSGNDTNFKVIDLHTDSMGASFQSRSVIYTVSKLLDRGVLPSDIFVLTEWSQPGRLLVQVPKMFSEEFTKNCEWNYSYDNKFNPVHDEELKFIRKYKSLTVGIGDNWYVNPSHTEYDSYENKNIVVFLKEFIKNQGISYKVEDRFESYLENILLLQSFLNENNIDYDFFFMNNVVEGYNESHAHFLRLDHNTEFLSKEPIIIPDIKKYKKIYQFSELSNQIWNRIDLSKFSLYSTDNFEYGGIDEYSMEMFGRLAYDSANKLIHDEVGDPFFGSHPHEASYVKFFESYIYPKIRKFFGDIEFDYTDMWSEEKYNMVTK